MTPIPPRDDDDLTAAEYVLGVQDLPARQATEARLRGDAAFAASVRAWEARFAGLDAAFDDAPVPDLMPRIEARIFGREAAPRPAFWRNWIAGALAALAVAAVVVALVPGFRPNLGAPVTVAVLSGEAQDLRFDVSRRGDEVTVTRVAGAAPGPSQSQQLWLIAGEAAPVALGLLDGGSDTVSVPALAPGMVLAVSLEPRGGSLTGAPTGPVLVSGTVGGAP